MNKLLSIYKEPGSGGAITFPDPSLSWIFLPSCCQVPLLAQGIVPARGCTAERALPSLQAPPSFAVEPSIFQLFKRSSSDFLKLQQYFSI